MQAESAGHKNAFAGVIMSDALWLAARPCILDVFVQPIQHLGDDVLV